MINVSTLSGEPRFADPLGDDWGLSEPVRGLSALAGATGLVPCWAVRDGRRWCCFMPG
jgi:hypothetical protein